MPSPSGSSSRGTAFLVSIPLASVAYAALRYNVFGSVPWAEFPIFVVNKGIALAGALLIAVSYLSNRIGRFTAGRPRGGTPLARQAGLAGFGLCALHVLASFSVWDAAHYPFQFRQGEPTEAGWACLGTGALAFALFSIPAIYSFRFLLPHLGPANWKRAQRVGYIGLALTAAHVLVIGVRNWLAVDAWPGGMPPITLLSFLACLTPLVARLAARQSGASARAGDEGSGRSRAGVDRVPLEG